ncbi:hypothetical protein RKD37_007425 [Streptomyces ambofaciens]
MAVAAEPVAEHVRLLLRRVHDVDAAGLTAGGVAGAPVVVRPGEEAAVVVRTLEAGPGGVAQGVLAAGAGGVDGQRVGAVPLAVAGAGLHVVVAVDDLAGTGVHEDVQLAGHAVLGGADEHGLPGEGLDVVLDPDHQPLGVDLVDVREPLAAGPHRLLGLDPGLGGYGDRGLGGGLDGADPALAVGEDDGVAADHRQTVVGALVGDGEQVLVPGGDLMAVVPLVGAAGGEGVEAAAYGLVGGGDGPLDGRGLRRGGRGPLRGRGEGGRYHHPCERHGQDCPGRRGLSEHRGSL